MHGTRVDWFVYTPGCGTDCSYDPAEADVRRPGRTLGGPGGSRASVPKPRIAPHELRRGLFISLRKGVLTVTRRSDRKQTAIHVPKGIVDAELEKAGLFYGWNDARGGGHVAFIPRAKLLRRLG
jgi:hypothetical protein